MTDPTEGSRRSGAALPVTVAVAGLVLIGVAQWGPTRLAMEDDLTDRSTQALRNGGLDGVQVAFTGQDGVLRGTVPAQVEAQRAVGLVEAEEGVRAVRSELSVGSDEPATSPTPTASPTTSPTPSASAAPADVKLSITPDTVAVTGRVPDQQTRDALIQTVGSTYGAVVQDRLTIDPAAGKAGLEGIGPVLQALGPDVRRAAIVLSGGQLTLAGFVAEEDAKAKAEQAAAAALGDGITVVDRMVVGP